MIATTSTRYALASDNYAGAHPEVLQALAEANVGEDLSYGRDQHTARLQDVLQTLFGPGSRAYPVFNGTGANVVALKSMVPLWGAVICADVAHINTDECGAPERIAGLKLLAAPTTNGKLTVDVVQQYARDFGNEHHAVPAVLSLTQCTEMGTVYTVAETAALCDLAHSLGLLVHMDGARLSNAAASLGVSLRALTTECGIDVVSLGGTKNGLLFGECVVVLNPTACTGLDYIRKFTMQLASKMRFISAQLVALYGSDLWLRSAQRANEQAALLRRLIERIPQVTPTQPTQANAVFATLPSSAVARLRQIADFQDWNLTTGEVRWMCSYATTAQTVRGFAEAVAQAVG